MGVQLEQFPDIKVVAVRNFGIEASGERNYASLVETLGKFGVESLGYVETMEDVDEAIIDEESTPGKLIRSGNLLLVGGNFFTPEDECITGLTVMRKLYLARLAIPIPVSGARAEGLPKCVVVGGEPNPSREFSSYVGGFNISEKSIDDNNLLVLGLVSRTLTRL